jgi:hypothetical protein
MSSETVRTGFQGTCLAPLSDLDSLECWSAGECSSLGEPGSRLDGLARPRWRWLPPTHTKGLLVRGPEQAFIWFCTVYFACLCQAYFFILGFARTKFSTASDNNGVARVLRIIKAHYLM